MQETFERVIERHGGKAAPVKHFYRRQYQLADGDWRTIYYAIFTDWKGKRRKILLGSEIKAAEMLLHSFEARNIKREDFNADKIKPDEGLTVARWADAYLDLQEIKTKRSLSRERELVATIKRLLGPVLLNELKREHLFQYRTQRLQEHIIRGGKEAAKKVSVGTVANELSCLCQMINLARESEIETATPSFGGLIQRSQRDRILDVKEEGSMVEAYPAWLKRLAVVRSQNLFIRR